MEPNQIQQFLTLAFLKGFNLALVVTVMLFFLFQVKHLLVDFFVQGRFPYMWANKGKLFHPGGWLHAGSHGLASMIIFYFLPGTVGENWLALALLLCGGETVTHFLIDFTKVNINRVTGWGPNTSPYFWDLLGVDQFLHQLTYLAMVLCWLFVIH